MVGRDPRFGAGLGARVEQGGVRFRLFTTTARRCELRLFADDGSVLETCPMDDAGDGIFEVFRTSARAGSAYQFVLDGRELPDPYARLLPRGVHGPAVVLALTHEFAAPRGPRRPLHERVIYELHVGTFSPEGTYEGARLKLRDLVELGVNTLELMPIGAFAGTRGWGYDGVAWFAPFAPYGSPDTLCAFIDAAHGLGLDVILDVVYNHFGPAGNHLRAYAPEYFASDVQNAWGEAPDYAHPAMRAAVLDSARMWLEDYRFDGLRLDAVHAITDRSSPHVVQELVTEIRAIDDDALIVAEDDRNEPALVTRLGLDAIWADDFHHQLRVTVTGEHDGYYASYRPDVSDIARTIERGWLYEGQRTAGGEPRGKPSDELEAPRFVYSIQNHDQVGNRAVGDRLSDVVSVDTYRMMSAVLLFLPMTPMLFMGQEWAASSPFLYFTDHDPELGAKVSAGRREEFKRFRAFSDPATRASIPDPQARSTFERSRLVWEERDREPHATTLALYTSLLKLRRTDPVLAHASRSELSADAVGDVLRVRRHHGRDERVLLANFARSPVPLRDLGIEEQGTELLWASRDACGGPELPPSVAVVFSRHTPSE